MVRNKTYRTQTMRAHLGRNRSTGARHLRIRIHMYVAGPDYQFRLPGIGRTMHFHRAIKPDISRAMDGLGLFSADIELGRTRAVLSQTRLLEQHGVILR